MQRNVSMDTINVKESQYVEGEWINSTSSSEIKTY